jgi:hypothetical protein
VLNLLTNAIVPGKPRSIALRRVNGEAIIDVRTAASLQPRTRRLVEILSGTLGRAGGDAGAGWV